MLGLALSAICPLLAAFVSASLLKDFLTADAPSGRVVRFEVVALPEPEKVPVFRESDLEMAGIAPLHPLAPPAPRFRPAGSLAAVLARAEIPEAAPFPGQGIELETEIPAEPDSLLAVRSYIAGVYERINQVRRYPEISRKLGEEGAVEVAFAIGRDGMLAGETELVASSPFSALNRAARRSVRKSSPFPPLPECVRKSVLPLKVRILFQLESR